eukprot:TRINITY_DN44_c0_g1_i1.p1 TRINITY_DN44_c0_g1~~TRINITY_DN44_c0_g1_i1.p1  ORF type:complete len:207 (+),score=92.41 TRINITY_DN44_c0_g1_i1:57-623(+)
MSEDKKKRKREKKEKKNKGPEGAGPTNPEPAPIVSTGVADQVEKKNDEDSQRAKKKAKISHVSPIAQPMGDKKLTKKVLKLNKEAAKEKALKRGVKEVVKAIRKREKGICVIAGDISPIDVITHIPILCEEAGIPYIYVPDKEELGLSSGCKRPTSVVLVVPKDSLKGKMKEVSDAIEAVPKPWLKAN